MVPSTKIYWLRFLSALGSIWPQNFFIGTTYNLRPPKFHCGNGKTCGQRLTLTIESGGIRPFYREDTMPLHSTFCRLHSVRAWCALRRKRRVLEIRTCGITMVGVVNRRLQIKRYLVLILIIALLRNTSTGSFACFEMAFQQFCLQIIYKISR